MTLRSVLEGVGSYLPETVATNQDLAARGLDTSDEWIVQRTGIRQRHIAREGETTSSLAIKAAQRALDMACKTPQDIDCVIVATTTPDHLFPATAARVQAGLGISRGFAFDVQAVCSGFVYALAVADNFIKSGQVKTALVIGAETLSRLVDWTDRGTCVLFGDGAGAVVLGGEEGARGILSTHLHADGKHYQSLYVDGGAGSTGTFGHIRMDGKEVFRHAVQHLAGVVDEALAAHGLTKVDWLVPHQANLRIINGIAKKLNLSSEQVVLTIASHANTSAASIPLALDAAVRDGRIQKGQLVLMNAMGGGFTWGAALVRM